MSLAVEDADGAARDESNCPLSWATLRVING